MTLIELIVVVVIVALAGSGLSFSLGALTKTNLKSGASKLAAAARFAYNRAIIRGTTVRIAFDVPGATLQHRRGQEPRDAGARQRRAAQGQRSTRPGKTWPRSTRGRRPRTACTQGLKPTFGASPFQRARERRRQGAHALHERQRSAGACRS